MSWNPTEGKDCLYTDKNCDLTYYKYGSEKHCARDPNNIPIRCQEKNIDLICDAIMKNPQEIVLKKSKDVCVKHMKQNLLNIPQKDYECILSGEPYDPVTFKCGGSDAKHSDAKHSDAPHPDAKHPDAKHPDAKHSDTDPDTDPGPVAPDPAPATTHISVQHSWIHNTSTAYVLLMIVLVVGVIYIMLLYSDTIKRFFTTPSLSDILTKSCVDLDKI